MGGLRKKPGTSGEAVLYVHRNKVLDKLQLTLPQFRRLCILKGVYPRDPKTKFHGRVTTRTYYHKKDVAFLAHEPLIPKFREIRAYGKKVRRYIHRQDYSKARSLKQREPQYTVHHLVKERYPSLEEAIRDLDDALSVLAMFAILPADNIYGLPDTVICKCDEILNEFYLWVAKVGVLKKVFISFKGYYYQAEVLGHKITWVTPHPFCQNLPKDVDYRVLLTFSEFYRTLLKFVNFKLYQMESLTYPPTLNNMAKTKGASYNALRTRHLLSEPLSGNTEKQEKDNENEKEKDSSSSSSEQQPTATVEGEEEDKSMEIEDVGDKKPQDEKQFYKPLQGSLQGPVDFDDSEFWWDCRMADLKRFPEFQREYIQPQWVFDSLNNNILLPVQPYEPGMALPAHLSPFVDDKEVGYTPRQREVLDSLIAAAEENSQLEADDKKSHGDDADETGESSDEDDIHEAEANFHKELVLEKEGLPSEGQQPKSAAGKEGENEEMDEEGDVEMNAVETHVPEDRKLQKQKQKEEEEYDRRKSMMSSKRKNAAKNQIVERLASRRQEVDLTLWKKGGKKKPPAPKKFR